MDKLIEQAIKNCKINKYEEYFEEVCKEYKRLLDAENQQLNLPVVSGSVFRCGFCGTPTDKDGNPMSLDYCNSLTDEQLNSAELVHGYCCYDEQQDNYITVTRDMAIDAQDMSLEGQQWRW